MEAADKDGAREVVGEDDGNNQLDSFQQPPQILIEAETMDGTAEGEVDGNNQPFRLDPFLQPPILKAFFEVLPLEELAKCRLVSKLWYEEFLSTWRSNATLKFDEEEIVSTQDDGSTTTTYLEEFLDLWEEGEWGSCPFKKFYLHQWQFEAEDVEQQRFLELVGGHATSLTLDFCSFVGREDFRRIIYQAFPKLQSLKMDGCRVDNVWYAPSKELLVYKEPTFGAHGLKSLKISGCLPDSMMDMLSHFHKLTSLYLEKGVADYRNLLETIRLIRAQDQTKLPLTNFDVEFEFKWGRSTASYIELLKLHDELNLPLQHLEIHFSGDADSHFNNEHVLRDILQYHSSTLKCLELGGYEYDLPELWKSFPFGVCFENLEKFAFQSRFFESLNFLRATPHLRVLKLNNIAFEDLDKGETDNLFSNSSQLELGDWTLPSLTDLTFDVPLSDGNLKKLMKWMPNVERLRVLVLDDYQFSMICNNWKNLKGIVDWERQLTDEGVIGIWTAYEADDSDDDGDEGTQGIANISKLRNLTSFATNSSRLTSASVHEGFLKLSNLKELSMGSFKWLDDEAKAAIQRRKIGRCQDKNYRGVWG